MWALAYGTYVRYDACLNDCIDGARCYGSLVTNFA